MNSSTDYTKEFIRDDKNADADSLKNKWWGVICYLAFLFFIPLLIKKDSKFIRFHANQGLVLFIFEACAGIIYFVLKLIFETFAVTSAVIFLNFIMAVFVIVIFSILISGVMNASSSLYKTLPFIGGIELLK